MKTYTLTALLMSVVLPVALLGSSTTDRQIEEAAKASYNYRTVLDGSVKAKSNDGIVTLTGKVEDQSDKTLAADTVSDMPGVVRVNNEIEVANTHKEYTENHPSASGILTESSPFAAAFYAYWLGHALCRHLWTV